MNFSSEKLSKETREDARCMKCDDQFYLVRRILDSLTAKRSVRLKERKNT